MIHFCTSFPPSHSSHSSGCPQHLSLLAALYLARGGRMNPGKTKTQIQANSTYRTGQLHRQCIRLIRSLTMSNASRTRNSGSSSAILPAQPPNSSVDRKIDLTPGQLYTRSKARKQSPSNDKTRTDDQQSNQDPNPSRTERMLCTASSNRIHLPLAPPPHLDIAVVYWRRTVQLVICQLGSLVLGSSEETPIGQGVELAFNRSVLAIPPGILGEEQDKRQSDDD